MVIVLQSISVEIARFELNALVFSGRKPSAGENEVCRSVSARKKSPSVALGISPVTELLNVVVACAVMLSFRPTKSRP